MKLDPETIDVRIEELERVVDGARHQTLNDEDHRKLRGAVETLGQMARIVVLRNSIRERSAAGRPCFPIQNTQTAKS